MVAQIYTAKQHNAVAYYIGTPHSGLDAKMSSQFYALRPQRI